MKIIEAVILGLFCTIISISAGISLAQEKSISQLQAELVSPWLVTVEGEARTRTLRITGAAQKSDGTLLLEATYGWTDAGQSSIPASASRVGQQSTLQFATQSSAQVVATQMSNDTFDGTFTTFKGATKAIKIQRISEDDLRLKVASAKTAREATTIVKHAGSSVNTLGSTEGVAISGYDSVAFLTEKRATKGAPEFTHEWMGAKWRFATQGNLDLFKANPEQYAPQYGGNCALGVSEGYVSEKPANGEFEVYDGKLYLFPPGSSGGPAGARYAWLQSGGGPYWRIRSAKQNWPKLKEALEAR